MGDRATGGGLGAAAMSVREALFSRREVPRSLNRSPGPERRCTGLTWAPEGAFVDRTIFGAPQGRKKLPARGGYPARPACGWEAGRHLVPQLRRGTTLRPFPDRQHARPPLRPRPFGPIVRAIRTWARESASSGPPQGEGFFLGHILLPASAWSPFRGGSFLTPLLPSAGL